MPGWQDMLFWLKKTVTVPFLPLYFVLLCGGFGVFLLWTKSRAKLGRVMTTLAFLVLVIFSNKAVSLRLSEPLEARYGPVPEFSLGQKLPPELARCRAIVVLGGGHADTTLISRVNQLSSAALSRLTEAVRLARLLPEAQLIVSGNNGPDHPSHAQVLEGAAISLGVDPARIVRMDEPRDTDEEAHGVLKRIGQVPFALVTSAWHMPRAMTLCERAGLSPLPCPADYLGKPGAEPEAEYFSWELESLERSTKAIHEHLGLFWARLQGKSSRT